MRVLPAILVVFVALGVAAAAMIIEAPKIEQRIAEEAHAALDGVGFTADVDGRDVTLIGIARDAYHRDQGLIRLAAIENVDILRDHTVMVPVEGEYAFFASRMASDEIYLQGVLPGDETRTVLVEHFKEIGTVRDFTTLASDAPDGWGERIVAAASALDALVQGTAIVIGDEVTIGGLYSESKSDAAFSRLKTPGWRVVVMADQRDALEQMASQTEALRTDLRDAADAIERIEADAATERDALQSEADLAKKRVAELEAMIGGVDAPPAPQTTETDQ